MNKMLYAAVAMAGMPGLCSAMFHYVSPQQVQKAIRSEDVNMMYDCDEDWKKLKDDASGPLMEERLDEKDIDGKKIQELEAESEYEKKAPSLEMVFFGNDTLYGKFNDLLKKCQGREEELADMNSEFFRWLIKNQRGDYESAKTLVSLYKSLRKEGKYILWKNIALALKLPVERV